MKCFKTIPRNICFEDYLYEYAANDSVFSNGRHILPNDIENQFAELEGEWSNLIRIILKRLTSQTNSNAIIFKSDELKVFYAFMNNLLARHPIAMAYFLSEEKYQKAIKNNVNVELVKRVFEELKFGSSEGFLKAALEKRYFDQDFGVNYIKYFEKMSFVFLKSESGRFITGDAPIRREIDYENKRYKSIFFPLSPNYAINFFDVKTRDRNRIRLIDEKQVDDLNKYVFAYDENRFIISQDKETLIQIKKEVL